jgi:hypothetical protein
MWSSGSGFIRLHRRPTPRTGSGGMMCNRPSKLSTRKALCMFDVVRRAGLCPAALAIPCALAACSVPVPRLQSVESLGPDGNPYRVSVSSWSRLLSSTSCRATAISNRVPRRRRLLAWPQNRRSLGSAWVCARRTVGNFDGTNGSGGFGCLFARKPPVAKTAVFLSSRSAPFNFVLASTFVGAKTRSPRDPFF